MRLLDTSSAIPSGLDGTPRRPMALDIVAMTGLPHICYWDPGLQTLWNTYQKVIPAYFNLAITRAINLMKRKALRGPWQWEHLEVQEVTEETSQQIASNGDFIGKYFIKRKPEGSSSFTQGGQQSSAS